MDYIKEQLEWDDKVADWFGVGAHLVSVSTHSSDIRVYKSGGTVAKFRRLTPATVYNRPNSLEDEYLVLCYLGEIYAREWLPVAKSYRREDGWEMMSMDAISPPVFRDPVANPYIESMREIWAVTRRVWELNKMGVSHGDLLPSNVGAAVHGGIVMLDFDQVIFSSTFRCFLRDFIGIPIQGRAAQFTVWDRMINSWPFRLFFISTRRMRSYFRREQSCVSVSPLGVTDRCRANGHADLVELAEIWTMSSVSGANSPGGYIAYYSLDVAGIHFPGERPWILRWEMIRRKVFFTGKRTVELGCNLGLLSIHASLSGAREVVGGDHNQSIIEAAKRTALLFKAEVAFCRTNFDEDPDWEDRLGGGDIVTALSLTYWLKDKERLWRYFGRFSEVIFEGHEAPAETELRFIQAGFSAVDRLGISERNRVVFHATRQVTDVA